MPLTKAGGIMLDDRTVKAAAVALLRRTLHISTTQSKCGNCGKNVVWTTFTPRCRHCGTEWMFVVAGYFFSDWSEEDYRADCYEKAPGLYCLEKGEGLATAVPSPGYLRRIK